MIASPPLPEDGPLPFFLASCPDNILPEAVAVTKKYGGFAAAGTESKDGGITDKPGADVEKLECWRSGWRGKVDMCLHMLRQLMPEKLIVAVAVAGGPACDWERAELRNRFCALYEDLRLKQVGDVEDLEAWLLRQGYKEKFSYAARSAARRAKRT